MKKKCTLIFFMVVLTGAVRLAAQPGTWMQKKSLYNLVSGRKYAVAFSLYGKGYIGTGYSYGFGYDGASNNDLWQYDTLHNAWTQMASMPVVGRQSATAFVVHGKAYITGGDGANGIVLKDLWEYDPLKNTWKRKADMPNTGLNAAHAFALHGKGYVGFGLDSVGYFQKGIWCYDPPADTWTRKKDFPAATVGESFALSNDSIAIAGLGVVTATGRSAGDIWLYDANADTWTQKNNFKGQPRFGEASFTANNTFYIIGGENNNYRFVTDGWKYDIAHDTWTSTGDFPGQPRGGAVSFVIGRNAYIGTGYDATSNDKTLGDLWELDTKSLQWKERASLGGGPRDLAVSFGMNKLGIVATGEDGTRFKKDVWAYNALLNDWKKLPDLSYGK
ncbi:MAG TPA: kelch repeat-containing protein, partial [Chitinophagaceae bacterium]|nr:kelch repeat-containing protein [Chitinophagaceae bacterium]